MRWDIIIEDAKLRVEANAIIGSVPFARHRSPLESVYPVILWYIPDEALLENWEEILITYDIWGNGVEEVVRIEREIRRDFHSERIQTIGDVRYWCLFAGSRDVDIDIETGIYARSLDFLYRVERASNVTA